MKIYLCREHTQVGDELIHRATTAKHRAEAWAHERNRHTGTRNFDVVECEDGVERGDI